MTIRFVTPYPNTNGRTYRAPEVETRGDTHATRTDRPLTGPEIAQRQIDALAARIAELERRIAELEEHKPDRAARMVAAAAARAQRPAEEGK